jgi:catechol 2,3-dioxygenase-like lactoylglutathione lyase family enzyme
MIMLTRALLFCIVTTAVPGISFAQTGFADLIDHIHLAAPDQAKAVDWYHTHFGAELTPEGTDRAMLGTTRLIFQKSESPKPEDEERQGHDRAAAAHPAKRRHDASRLH